VRREPLIIGGGPAGSAVAIMLASAGYRPVVLERTVGPSDKVCGDFLSDDAIQLARGLGVDPVALGAQPIRRVRLIHGERVVETALPFPAFGLSRRRFDAALLAGAEAVGVEVRTGQTVRGLTRENGEWMVRTASDHALTAETVFLATGKHDLRELPRARLERGAIGIKMYFALAAGPMGTLDGAIELTLFPGGYAGLQRVEDGKAVLCVAVTRAAFQRLGGGWPSLIAAIGQRSRRFTAMLADACALLPRPLAVAGIPYGYQAGSGSDGGVFRVGDQAAVIPSLTGDGMAIALHSGRLAAEMWLAGDDAVRYQLGLGRVLAPRMRLAGLLHFACMSGSVQAGLVRGAGVFPGLLRRAASRTRLPVAAPGDARYFSGP
jgi:flavin-dependent dehydrogenase